MFGAGCFEKAKVGVIQAARTGAAPVLDSKLDETCWKQAKLVTDFVDIKNNTNIDIINILFMSQLHNRSRIQRCDLVADLSEVAQLFVSHVVFARL